MPITWIRAKNCSFFREAYFCSQTIFFGTIFKNHNYVEPATRKSTWEKTKKWHSHRKEKKYCDVWVPKFLFYSQYSQSYRWLKFAQMWQFWGSWFQKKWKIWHSKRYMVFYETLIGSFSTLRRISAHRFEDVSGSSLNFPLVQLLVSVCYNKPWN